MRWGKSGLLYSLPPGLPWAASHAAVPAIEVVGERARVYFSPRDAEGRTRLASFDLDLSGAPRVLATSPRPLLDLGRPGAFDESGTTMSCVVEHEGRKYLYYTGWSLGTTVPFYLFAGLAISDDGGANWRRISEAPLLDRADADPYMTLSPWVLLDDGLWRMWYVSGSRWEHEGGRPKHYYNVRYAESQDGIKWRRTGIVCLDYGSPEEFAISRPCVLKDRDLYRAWYACRGTAYRIGYAESKDGVSWVRKDDLAGIEASPAGWDSQMLAYPCVFDHSGKRFMLYNGNDYGRTGIGLASLHADDCRPVGRRPT